MSDDLRITYTFDVLPDAVLEKTVRGLSKAAEMARLVLWQRRGPHVCEAADGRIELPCGCGASGATGMRTLTCFHGYSAEARRG